MGKEHVKSEFVQADTPSEARATIRYRYPGAKVYYMRSKGKQPIGRKVYYVAFTYRERD